MRRVLIAVAVVALVLAGCKEEPQPAEVDTVGADRSADGTTGTGEPLSPAAGSTAAAEQLGTVAPSAASTGTAPVITGTADVNAAKTQTTSTIQGPGGTTTASVATPTQTTATVKKP
jgi:hypothetical protein